MGIRHQPYLCGLQHAAYGGGVARELPFLSSQRVSEARLQTRAVRSRVVRRSEHDKIYRQFRSVRAHLCRACTLYEATFPLHPRSRTKMKTYHLEREKPKGYQSNKPFRVSTRHRGRCASSKNKDQCPINVRTQPQQILSSPGSDELYVIERGLHIVLHVANTGAFTSTALPRIPMQRPALIRTRGGWSCFLLCELLL